MKHANERCPLAIFLLMLLSTATALGQSYKPAVEYESLMNLRFYEASGGFLVEKLQYVFWPAGLKKATFVIARPNGEVVKTVSLPVEPIEKYPAFGMSFYAAGTAAVGEPGDFLMSVTIDGQAITTLPFSLKRSTSTDPYNPQTTYVREGPWRDLGYFSVRSDDPDSHLKFNWWTCVRELPAGMKSPHVTLHLLMGGREIAAGDVPVVPTQTDWQPFNHELSLPPLPRARWMTLADLTKKDGEYTVVVKANGQPFKSYKAEVRGGQLQRLPQNRLETEPHTAFISPRMIDTASSSLYQMRDLYWVRKSEK